MNWVKLTEQLPAPNKLVWIKRCNGSIYFGSRKDKPLSIDQDASKQCHWYGQLVINHKQQYTNDIMINNNGDWHPNANFSDVTVDSWMIIEIPIS